NQSVRDKISWSESRSIFSNVGMLIFCLPLLSSFFTSTTNERTRSGHLFWTAVAGAARHRYFRAGAIPRAHCAPVDSRIPATLRNAKRCGAALPIALQKARPYRLGRTL